MKCKFKDGTMGFVFFEADGEPSKGNRSSLTIDPDMDATKIVAGLGLANIPLILFTPPGTALVGVLKQ